MKVIVSTNLDMFIFNSFFKLIIALLILSILIDGSV